MQSGNIYAWLPPNAMPIYAQFLNTSVPCSYFAVNQSSHNLLQLVICSSSVNNYYSRTIHFSLGELFSHAVRYQLSIPLVALCELYMLYNVFQQVAGCAVKYFVLYSITLQFCCIVLLHCFVGFCCCIVSKCGIVLYLELCTQCYRRSVILL